MASADDEEFDLPDGWTPVRFDRENVAFRHAGTGLSLRVSRIDYAPQVTDAAPQYRWEVSCERDEGSGTSSRFVACLATRPAAIYGLLAGMEQLNEVSERDARIPVDEAADLLSVRDGVARATGGGEPADGRLPDEL